MSGQVWCAGLCGTKAPGTGRRSSRTGDVVRAREAAGGASGLPTNYPRAWSHKNRRKSLCDKRLNVHRENYPQSAQHHHYGYWLKLLLLKQWSYSSPPSRVIVSGWGSERIVG
jgi:hypothetical protein